MGKKQKKEQIRYDRIWHDEETYRKRKKGRRNWEKKTIKEKRKKLRNKKRREAHRGG